MSQPITLNVETAGDNPPPPPQESPSVVAVPIPTEQPATMELAERVGGMTAELTTCRSEVNQLKDDVAGLRAELAIVKAAKVEEIEDEDEQVIEVTPTAPPTLDNNPPPKRQRGTLARLLLG